MATITDPSTRSALSAIGCLVDNQLDNGSFARVLAQHLEANHIAAGLADVAVVHATIGQLVTDVVGHSDEQVVELAKPLLGTGADGRVQKALTNGNYLCGSRTQVQVNIAGDIKVVSVATRFLSSDPDVLKRYAVETDEKAFKRTVARRSARNELMVARQPLMAPIVGASDQEVTAILQNALNPGTATP